MDEPNRDLQERTFEFARQVVSLCRTPEARVSMTGLMRSNKDYEAETGIFRGCLVMQFAYFSGQR